MEESLQAIQNKKFGRTLEKIPAKLLEIFLNELENPTEFSSRALSRIFGKKFTENFWNYL